MVMLRLTAEQYRKLPVLVDESTCVGKTYIVTGSNSGLGLETARHLVKAKAACVVLAVRDLSKGEGAKKDIGAGIKGSDSVIKVMHLDMSSTSSIQTFSKEVSSQLDRIDGVVCNAGIMVDAWTQVEGLESSLTVNVVNTLFLGALLMPKLSECARQFEIRPTLVFIVSVLGFTFKA